MTSSTATGAGREAFVDRLCLGSLVWLLLFGRGFSSVRFFDPLTPFQQRLYRLLRRLGWCTATWTVVDAHIGQIPPEDGEISRQVAEAAAVEMSIRIREELKHVRLLSAFGDMWPLDHLLLYLLKPVELELTHECRRILLCQWLNRHGGENRRPGVLLLKRHHWASHLAEFAGGRGIRLRQYFNLGESLSAFCRRAVNAVLRGVPRLCRAVVSRVANLLKQRRGEPPEAVSRPGEPQSPVRDDRPGLAVRYWFRKLSMEPDQRTELFFLNEDDLHAARVHVYDIVRDRPLSEAESRTVRGHGVTCHGVGPGFGRWRRTADYSTLLVDHVRKTILPFLLHSFRGRHDLWASQRLLHLMLEYLFRLDYFRANNIRMVVGTMFSLTVAETLAIRSLGGLSVAYQVSISDISHPIRASLAGETGRLVFSEHFGALARKTNPPQSVDVVVGSLGETGRAERIAASATAMREDLRRAGARFVISVFDENYFDRWDIFTAVETASQEYRWLLQWLLENEQLGIIVKPKKGSRFKPLFEGLAELGEAALKTGRLKVLSSEDTVGHVFPAQAAMASDLCVGEILGGTAAFECWRAGTPTVVVDDVGNQAHPLHELGGEDVVLGSWERLKAIVEESMERGSVAPGVGDWSGFASFFDPYGDGRAVERMNRFIMVALDALHRGESAEDALAAAKAEVSGSDKH